MIGKRRAIRETDFGMTCDECLIRDSVRDLEERDYMPNLEPELTEAEFLVDQLMSNGLVDTDAVVAIRRQFLYLTRRGEFAPDEPRKLTSQMVFEEIRDRIDKGEPVSRGAEVCDVIMVDPKGVDARLGREPKPTFKFKTFHEWKHLSWQIRVKAKAQEMKETAANGGKAISREASAAQQYRMM